MKDCLATARCLIDAEVSSVDHFQRGGDRWTLRPSAIDHLDFAEIECQIAKADFFAGVAATTQALQP